MQSLHNVFVFENLHTFFFDFVFYFFRNFFVFLHVQPAAAYKKQNARSVKTVLLTTSFIKQY